MARKSFYHMKRDAAAVRIQTYMRGKLARKKYTDIKISVIILQTGFRAMAARDKLRYRRQTSASTCIQVGAVLIMLYMFLKYFFCCLKF